MLSQQSSDSDSRNLDLLRAIAVLAVYSDHLAFTLAGPKTLPFSTAINFLGHAGVLIFFVHTSLVLMRSMARLRLSGLDLYRGFMVRRFFRIYPLSIAMVLAVLLFRIPSFSDGEPFHWVTSTHWLASLALVQNLTGSPQVLDPLWSLPFEVQMYCVLPLVFFAVAYKARRAAILQLASAVSTLAVLWAGAHWSLELRGLATLRFAPCFLSGVLAYTLFFRFRPRIPGVFWPLFVVLALCAYCVGGALATGGKPPLEPTTPGTVCGWLLCLALGLAIPQFREIRSRWVRLGSHVVAKYSFGIYLTHVPVFWLCFWRLNRLSVFWQWTLAAALSCLAPFIAYHAIEEPFIKFGKRLSEKTSARRVVLEPSDSEAKAA